MDKVYRAIFVASDPENGILFAKRSNSEKETMAIFGEEIYRLITDYEGEVVIRKKQDGYGESVLESEFENKTMKLKYKVIFEEEENNEM